MQPLNLQFPIVFENGHKIEQVGFWCRYCGSIPPHKDLFGTVSRLIEPVADVSARFVCEKCGKESHYRIRLKHDRTYQYIKHGEWVTESSKLGRYARYKLAFFGFIMVSRIKLNTGNVLSALKHFRRAIQRHRSHDKES
jgi:hypothetical protein